MLHSLYPPYNAHTCTHAHTHVAFADIKRIPSFLKLHFITGLVEFFNILLMTHLHYFFVCVNCLLMTLVCYFPIGVLIFLLFCGNTLYIKATYL